MQQDVRLQADELARGLLQEGITAASGGCCAAMTLHNYCSSWHAVLMVLLPCDSLLSAWLQAWLTRSAPGCRSAVVMPSQPKGMRMYWELYAGDC